MNWPVGFGPIVFEGKGARSLRPTLHRLSVRMVGVSHGFDDRIRGLDGLKGAANVGPGPRNRARANVWKFRVPAFVWTGSKRIIEAALHGMGLCG